MNSALFPGFIEGMRENLPSRHPARRAARRRVLAATRKLTKRVLFCGQRITLACDGRCDKAWGINGRPKRQLSANEDDYVYIGDDELGRAPPPGKTCILSEGGHLKPSARPLRPSDSDRMNKWCARECERRVRVPEGEPIVLRNMAQPRPNIPRPA